MTREEAIKWLKTFKYHTGMAELSQAFDVAIEALEQEPVLNKIRAEIEETKNNPLFNMVSKDTILEVIIEIIDKHKAESEE